MVKCNVNRNRLLQMISHHKINTKHEKQQLVVNIDKVNKLLSKIWKYIWQNIRQTIYISCSTKPVLY